MFAGKVMFSIFWDAEGGNILFNDGVLLVDYVDKGHTITGAYYTDLLYATDAGEKSSKFGVES